MAGVASAATAPGAPVIGAATLAGLGEVSVSWTAPDDGGAPITGYMVTPWAGFVQGQPREFASSATTQTLTGLATGSELRFTVRARNVFGYGAASVRSNVVDTTVVPSVPVISSVVPGDGQISLAWSVPAANGPAISSYVIRPYVGSIPQPTITVGPSPATTTVLGLTNGTTYAFTVAAISSFGSGSESVPVEMTAGVPVAPQVTSLGSGDGQATVSWTGPADNGDPVTGYVVTPHRFDPLGSVPLPPITFASPATSQVVTGLTNGLRYQFAVSALNTRGTGPASPLGSPVMVGLPAAPLIGVATLSGPGEVTVSWTAPALDGRPPPTGYVVTPWSGFFPGQRREFASPATTQTLTGLSTGAKLRFTVAAVSSAGEGLPSASRTSSTRRGFQAPRWSPLWPRVTGPQRCPGRCRRRTDQRSRPTS